MHLKKILITLLTLFLPLILYADMGAIVPVESVNLDEPAQRAIIAYDGFEEILILETELKPSESTKVLRFIPLPSLPKIDPAPAGSFFILKKLLQKYDLQYIMHTKSLGQKIEGVSIVINKTIGAHDITVVKVSKLKDFINWIEKYLRSQGYNYRFKNDQTYIDVIMHYLNSNINYFALDVVNLTKKSSIQPIMYRFKSKKLYYPLVATNVLRSYGTIELFIFSEFGRHSFNTVYGFIPSTTAVVSSIEMSEISPEISKLLGRHAILQAFKYKGKLFFSSDIMEDSGIITIELKNPLIFKNSK